MLGTTHGIGPRHRSESNTPVKDRNLDASSAGDGIDGALEQSRTVHQSFEDSGPGPLAKALVEVSGFAPESSEWNS